MMWRTIDADGCTWEVRAVTEPEGKTNGEFLEFRPREVTRPPRRIAIQPGDFDAMDEGALRTAFQQARPIGGDHYGRPGKTMGDVP